VGAPLVDLTSGDLLCSMLKRLYKGGVVVVSSCRASPTLSPTKQFTIYSHEIIEIRVGKPPYMLRAMLRDNAGGSLGKGMQTPLLPTLNIEPSNA